MTVTSPPITADPAVVRVFVETIHAAAATAFKGADRPGLLQLGRIHPADGKYLSLRYRIGDVEQMTAQAVRDANAGFNVYIEGRTVSETATGRGDAAATRGVFAFVIDDDADKGKGARSSVAASMVVSSSPGNTHQWIFLDRALTADQATPLGKALRETVGGDSATGNPTQPFRVAGTPNFPNRAKLARGRVVTTTKILEAAGKTWSTEDLRAAFPARPQPEASAASGTRATGKSGRTSDKATEILAKVGGDRSGLFHAAAAAAFADDLTVDDFEDLVRRHPDGCGGKYLKSSDRLRREIERSWGS